MFKYYILIVTLLKYTLSHEGNQQSFHHQSKTLEDLGYSSKCVAKSLSQCDNTVRHNSFDTHSLVTSLSHEMINFTKTLASLASELKETEKPLNCADIQRRGFQKSGVYTIYPNTELPHLPATVFCDQDIDSGGWTVIQARMDSTVRENFLRPWTDYLLGFGKIDGEHWIGLKNIHSLTNNVLMELRIDLADWEGNTAYAKYNSFRLEDSATNFKLRLGKYEGNAGDGLSAHKDNEFTTIDRDNDKSDKNCADLFKGAFWYVSCHTVNLNGLPDVGKATKHAEGINWNTWMGYKYSLKNVKMMVRPAFRQNVAEN